MDQAATSAEPSLMKPFILSFAAVMTAAGIAWCFSGYEGFVLMSAEGALTALGVLVVGCLWLTGAGRSKRNGRAGAWLHYVPPLVIAGAVGLLVTGLPQRVRREYDTPRLRAAAESLLTGTSSAEDYRHAHLGTQHVKFVRVDNGRVEFHLRGPILDWPVLVYAPKGRPTEHLPRQLGELETIGGDWYKYWYKF